MIQIPLYQVLSSFITSTHGWTEDRLLCEKADQQWKRTLPWANEREDGLNTKRGKKAICAPGCGAGDECVCVCVFSLSTLTECVCSPISSVKTALSTGG